MNYNKKRAWTQRIILVILMIIAIAAGAAIGTGCQGEDQLATCWIMCKPGSRVTVRATPRKSGMETGYLECGDAFLTDGVSRDGWIRCYGAGEGGWVYCGYVVTEEPVLIGERYICAAVKQVACRKWIRGPKVDGRCWLRSGEFCQVFCQADGWSITSRGYIQSEWLEVSPE